MWLVFAVSPVPALIALGLAIGLLYLVHINRLLSGTPEQVRALSPRRWTPDEILDTYSRLQEQPIDTKAYATRLPPKLDRRYIVTGGSGLVGGHIVLQLLARGQSSACIRIVDYQKPHRRDMLEGPAADVEFIKTDISSAESTDAAFLAPWDPSVGGLPLTVFHTAAVIIPSERSKLVYGFPEAVNVRGTKNVVSAAVRAGADVLVSTSSASISIRPVEFWVAPWKWKSWPLNHWQILNEADFSKPLRPHDEFFGNYPASKAAAERIVCSANSSSLRTGCIRPANGVYGHPSDNTVGGPLNMGNCPSWTSHVVQSFVHGVNCAVAHLHFEAFLAQPGSEGMFQAGRPFVVTDPNPPITYGDLYSALATLAITPFRLIRLPPLPLLLLSYVIEAYTLLRIRYPSIAQVLPPISGDLKYMQPGLFSITTHLIASNETSSLPVDQGGLGYKGILTTLEGMCQEVIEWNLEHSGTNAQKRTFQSSVSLAEEIRRVGTTGKMIQA